MSVMRRALITVTARRLRAGACLHAVLRGALLAACVGRHDLPLVGRVREARRTSLGPSAAVVTPLLLWISLRVKGATMCSR